MRLLILFTVIAVSHSTSGQHNFSSDIRINQIGFYPMAPKIAVVAGTGHDEFYIASPDNNNKKLFTGKLSQVRQSAFSERKSQVADFSSFQVPGLYVVVVPGLGCSYPFEISPAVHQALTKGSIKAFYYQRFSIALSQQFAGKWSRPYSHPDREVMIHPSAADASRPSGTIISSPRGWIDAGDYNKYIVNSGITMGTLFSAYEDFSGYFDTLKLDIPERANAIPDLLDETLWNLRWMFTMQDPNDGGVYHKCTNAKFDPMIMPHLATEPRYVVQKGTAATLDFAAVMAQAARIVKRFPSQLPGLSDSCLAASRLAWNWATKNPRVVYNQNAMNKTFDPDVTTGGYGDQQFTDEFIWAAAELFATTNDLQYYKSVNVLPDSAMPLPSWSQVRLLGYYTLVRLEKQLPKSVHADVKDIKKRILNLADNMIKGVDDRYYMTVMGASPNDFIWGSNSVAANQGIVLLNALQISHDRKYLKYALGNLDYLLGRNATGYCYVTGYGDKPPMHIHHRPSEADGIVEPVPGLLSGGPNPGKQDKCNYPSSVPDEAFVDDVCSYASNEVAINWNAPLVYLLSGIEVAYAGK